MRTNHLTSCVSLLVLLSWGTVSVLMASQPIEPQWQTVRQVVATEVTFKPAITDERKNADLAQVTAVAVRGVFPLDDQVTELARELQLDKATAAERFDIVDFALERQSLPGDPDRWKEAKPKWERLTLVRTRELLASVADWAREIVPSEHRDPVTVTPLPQLAEGEWTHSAVGHPLLEEQDAKGLLFRFLDLDVEPGFYYRYRVKLTVANPMRGERTDDPFLGVGATRETPWSRPSRAVRVGRSKN